MAALAHFTVHCSTAELPPDAGSAPETLPRGCLSRLPSATDHLQCRGMVYQRICAVRSLPVSLVGQDRWLSPTRPGFNSRTGKVSASRAPLAERSAVNRQVLGSIPSGGVQFCLGPYIRQELKNFGSEGGRGEGTSRTHGATAARRIPDPKVGGSNPSGFICLQSSVGRAVGC